MVRVLSQSHAGNRDAAFLEAGAELLMTEPRNHM
jgi:hypothetical protein